MNIKEISIVEERRLAEDTVEHLGNILCLAISAKELAETMTMIMMTKKSAVH